MRDDPTLESLGPANRRASVVGGELVDGTLYVGSRVIRPAVVGVVDLEARTVRKNYEIHGSGRGALALWGYQALNGGEDLYVAMSGDGTLYHIDPAEDVVSLAADFEDHSFVWDLDAARGEQRLYAAAYPNSTVFEYDHRTGEYRSLGPAVEGEEYARSIAVTAETIYVGVGSHAHLIAIDRETGDRTDLLPGELAHCSFVNALTVGEEAVYAAVGTAGEAYVLRADRTGEDADVVRELQGDIGMGSLLAVDGDLYFDADGLYRYDTAADELTKVHDRSARNLFGGGDSIIGASSQCWTYDPATGAVDAFDLESEGLLRGVQEAQSIAVLDGAVYVGGSNQATIHDPASGEKTRIEAPGEPKRMAPVDGEMYMGIYPHAIVAKHEFGDPGAAEELARIGHGQNRPRDVHYHGPSGMVFVGTRPMYGKHGGALATLDPDGDELVSVDRNVIADQSITAIASTADTLYLGSEIHGGMGTRPRADAARLAALDPETREVRWAVAPFPDVDGIPDLVVGPDGDRLYGLTDAGTLFVFDPERREGEAVQGATFDGTAGELVVSDETVYGTTDQVVFAIEPATARATVIVRGLDGDWHNTPSIAADEDGTLYAIKDRDLLKIVP